MALELVQSEPFVIAFGTAERDAECQTLRGAAERLAERRDRLYGFGPLRAAPAELARSDGRSGPCIVVRTDDAVGSGRLVGYLFWPGERELGRVRQLLDELDAVDMRRLAAQLSGFDQ
jgi:hypothetical protein